MSAKMMAAFVATFIVVYVAISLIDSGTIYWAGLIGSVIGALLAFLMLTYLRRDTPPSGANH